MTIETPLFVYFGQLALSYLPFSRSGNKHDYHKMLIYREYLGPLSSLPLGTFPQVTFGYSSRSYFSITGTC